MWWNQAVPNGWRTLTLVTLHLFRLNIICTWYPHGSNLCYKEPNGPMNAFTVYFETCVNSPWSPLRSIVMSPNTWPSPGWSHGSLPSPSLPKQPKLARLQSFSNQTDYKRQKNSYKKKKETKSNEMTSNGIKLYCLICILCKFWVQYAVDGSVFSGSWMETYVFE